LAIAKRAVELHHGLMRASNQNPGLLVEIDLPVPVEEDDALQSAPPAAHKTKLTSSR
jgi:hypothetical protein